MSRPSIILAIAIILLLAIASFMGISTTQLYVRESANWRLQSEAQDRINLFLVTPILIAATLLYIARTKIGRAVFLGTILYLGYTFVIYCFSVHFNKLFLVYCSILGLCFFTLLVHFKVQQVPIEKPGQKIGIITGIYFLLIGLVFSLLWLSDIIPAIINNTVPASIADAGLVTNPVHVLDLCIMLPLFIIAGIFLIRKNPGGFRYAPELLTFCFLMDITIGFLNSYMIAHGLPGNPVLTLIMVLLALISLALLIARFKKGKISANI